MNTISKDDLKDIKKIADKLENKQGETPGQAAFNAVKQVAPNLADELQGGALDCFNSDSSLPAGRNMVKSFWEEIKNRVEKKEKNPLD